MGHRYYDASAGRFLTRDPIGYSGGSNLYAYVGSDPVNAADPDGTFANLIGGGLVNVGISFAMAKLTGRCYTWSDAGKDFLVGAATAGGVGLIGKGLQWLNRGKPLFFHGSSTFDADLIEDGGRHWASSVQHLSKWALEIGGRKRLLFRPPWYEIKDLSKTSPISPETAAKYRVAIGNNLWTWRKGFAGEYYYQKFGWRQIRTAFLDGFQTMGGLRLAYEGMHSRYTGALSDCGSSCGD